MSQDSHVVTDASGRRHVLSLGVNLVLILLGALVLYSRVSTSATDETGLLRSGDRLPVTAGLDLAARDRTLIVAVRAACPYAERSMPFYRQLGKLQAAGAIRAGIVAVSPDSDVIARNLFRIHEIDLPNTAGVSLASLGIRATPTLVLTDRGRRVLRVWEGRLSPARQSEVLAAVGVAHEQFSRPGQDGDTSSVGTSERR